MLNCINLSRQRNPCPCGFYPNMKKCSCSSIQIKRYQGRVSGPLLDRIDMNIEVKPIEYDELFSNGFEENSTSVRERVEAAIKIQRKRYKEDGINFNSQLDGKLIKKYINLGEKEEKILEKSFKTMELSARGTHRILKLSRTIADLDGSKEIGEKHLMEALFYRNGIKNKEN